MKHCKFCGRELRRGQGPIKYCSKQCQMATWKKACHWCKKEFIPSEQRVIFCSRSCGAKWKCSQPEIMARMIAGKDLEALGRAISLRIRSNPAEIERRRALGRKLQHPWRGNISAPTRHEAQVLALFPEAQWAFQVATGESSKLGRPHYYRMDVAWPDIKLDVEIDGTNHDAPKQKLKDAERTRFLNGRGWSVLRFTNREVKYFLPRIKLVIESSICKLKATPATA